MKSIPGYDEYEQDFQLLALPEYRWMAEQLLIEAFEDYQPPEPFHVYLPDCLCGEPSGYTFFFEACTEGRGHSLLYTGFYYNTPRRKEEFRHEAVPFPWQAYPPHG